MEPEQKPLVVIVGPTASGKSELAMKIAKKFNGEIICADSRTIYKDMDIGTAKPSKSDQKQIKHHLLNVITPDQTFSVFDFQKQAKSVIKNIRSKRKLPIMVGGTALYVDSIVFDYQFPKPNPITKKINDYNVDQLRNYCMKNEIILPENEQNKRHLLTAISRKNNEPSRRKHPIENTIIVGITTNKQILEERIAERAEYIFSNGIVKEARKLGKKYGWDNEAMSANIYRLMYKLERKELELEQVISGSIILDKRLVKRQLTWLKRNPFIIWHTLKTAEHFLFDVLAKTHQK